jgi:hypothetical protein
VKTRDKYKDSGRRKECKIRTTKREGKESSKKEGTRTETNNKNNELKRMEAGNKLIKARQKNKKK